MKSKPSKPNHVKKIYTTPTNKFSYSARLQRFDSRGRIHVPKLIRELFRGCYFLISVDEGRIVLEPVKIDDSEVDKND